MSIHRQVGELSPLSNYADILLTIVEGHRGTTRVYRYKLASGVDMPRGISRYKMTPRDN